MNGASRNEAKREMLFDVYANVVSTPTQRIQEGTDWCGIEAISSNYWGRILSRNGDISELMQRRHNGQIEASQFRLASKKVLYRNNGP